MAGMRQGGGGGLSAISHRPGKVQASGRAFEHDVGIKATKERTMPRRMLNLMFDPRVVRGSTCHESKFDSKEDALPQKKYRQIKQQRDAEIVTTPKSVSERNSMNIQTDAYLEELIETISEFEVDTQTDSFLERPPTPLFIPQKSGPDVGTQIEEGDLFNFDEEVEPIVEVLVGRTLEQALMEVMEEKQIETLHSYQEHFEQIRAAELVATQRMEAAERRVIEEKERRVQQEKKRLEEENLIKEKVEVQMYVKGFLKTMTDSIFAILQKANYFYDPVEREVETLFIPWLEHEVLHEVDKIACVRSTVRSMHGGHPWDAGHW